MYLPRYDFNAQSFYIKNNLNRILFSLSVFTQMISFHPPTTVSWMVALPVWKGKTEKLLFQNLGPSAVGTREVLPGLSPASGQGPVSHLAPCLSLPE